MDDEAIRQGIERAAALGLKTDKYKVLEAQITDDGILFDCLFRKKRLTIIPKERVMGDGKR